MVVKTPIVDLRNITKSFQLDAATEVPVLRDVSLTIAAGEIVAILGPSGSGKSTLMNMIGCLDIPTTGEYYFDSQLTNSLSSDELAELRSRDISFIFQSFHLLNGKTVFQNVMLPLLYQRSLREINAWQSKPPLKRHSLNQRSGTRSQICYRVGNGSELRLPVLWLLHQNYC